MEQGIRLRGQNLGSLIQQNFFPNNPTFRDIMQKCERDLRPKVIDASQIVKDPAWAALTPEQRLGFFLETFWIDRHLNYFKCDRMFSASFESQRSCLISNGFDFQAKSLQNCHVTVTEKSPVSGDRPKTWDGKATGSDNTVREITVDLTGLDETLIRENSGSFDLYFEIRDPTSVVRQFGSSDDRKTWTALPSPPLATAFSGTDDQKYEDLSKSRNAWASEMSRYGLVEVPGFKIATYFDNRDTSSEAGLKRIRDNRMRTFLKLSTAHFGHAYPTDEATSIMTGAFVDTVKLIISDCKR